MPDRLCGLMAAAWDCRRITSNPEVIVSQAYRTFMEEAAIKPDAFRACRKSFFGGAPKSKVLRATSRQIALCRKYILSTREEIRITCAIACSRQQSVEGAKSLLQMLASYLPKIASPPTTQALNSSRLPCILRTVLQVRLRRNAHL
jgi:hypothetical protein